MRHKAGVGGNAMQIKLVGEHSYCLTRASQPTQGGGLAVQSSRIVGLSVERTLCVCECLLEAAENP
jgi:hypothetical protein